MPRFPPRSKSGRDSALSTVSEENPLPHQRYSLKCMNIRELLFAGSGLVAFGAELLYLLREEIRVTGEFSGALESL